MNFLIHRFARNVIPKLPKILRRQLVLAGHYAAAGLEDFIRFPNLTGSLLSLRRKGFQPTLAIDLGAFHGEWTQEFTAVFPSCRVLMVEAQTEKEAVLRPIVDRSAGAIELEIALLGAADGTAVTFHSAENGSSVFREQGRSDKVSVTKTLERLDSLLSRRKQLEVVNFLKLDTQGYEIEILKGATETLARTEFVLLEASLIPINEGCPLALDVLNFMASKGFRWLDICGQWRRPDKMLWQIDFLFVRENSPFVPEATLDGPASET